VLAAMLSLDRKVTALMLFEVAPDNHQRFSADGRRLRR